jgi:tetrahydromethanopterin S-methyltransferase subunit B
VQKLEVILAQYLKTPNQLPSKRPLCKPSKKDRKHTGSGKVDAISYLTIRIAKLEISINELRESIDTRNPMPYGFASYTHIEDAHSIAYAARKKGPGCHISLAPKPHDLLWQNLPMIPAARRTRKFWDSIWMIVLTLIFIVPNVLTSVFLSDFSHLALFWSGFRTNLAAHPTGWGIVQGIAAPLVQTLLYLALPTIFRRLYTHSGDVSKTSRERHVTSRLYAFFVFNNLLVFSLFGCFSRFVAAVIAAQDIGVWTAIRNGHLFSNIMISLCNLSTFWLTWQMQRNLGAAIDLIQAWPLIYGSIRRKFFAPTPRELIALSAPQTFEYADYYNNFLFVATIGLCFGALQPLILPITAFYLALDGWFKTYLLQYVLITKTESGGAFWRMLVNRLLIGALLGNAVIALVVGAQGIGSIESVRNGGMLYAMIPLPFLLAAFKWHCKRAFDTRMQFYTTHSFAELEGADGEAALPGDEKKRKRADRVAVRFGHPALYKRLMTPMVHARSKHLIKELYTRHVENEDGFTTSRAGTGPGYSDVYMSEMDPAQPGAAALPTDITQATLPDVELVKEEDLDFENFKRRAEFREERGGDGELYGRPDDLISRPGTPSTTTTMTAVGATGGSGRSTRASSVTRLGDGGQDAPLGGGNEAGTVYGRGYQRPRAASVDVEIPDSKL